MKTHRAKVNFSFELENGIRAITHQDVVIHVGN